MRGLKSRKTAKQLMEGLLVHYSFFRPHESLKDKTPAEKAEIRFPFRNWLDITRQPTQITRLPQAQIVTPRFNVPKQSLNFRPRQTTLSRDTIFVSEAPSGGQLLSRRRVRGSRVIKRMRGRVV